MASLLWKQLAFGWRWMSSLDEVLGVFFRVKFASIWRVLLISLIHPRKLNPRLRTTTRSKPHELLLYFCIFKIIPSCYFTTLRVFFNQPLLSALIVFFSWERSNLMKAETKSLCVKQCTNSFFLSASKTFHAILIWSS